MGRLLAVILATVGLSGASVGDAADPASGAAPAKPPPVYVGTGGIYVKATQGNYCPDSARLNRRDLRFAAANTPVAPSAIACPYSPAYPLPLKGELAVVPGAKLRVDAGKRARSLSARLVRVYGHGIDTIETDYLRFVKVRGDGSGRYWRVTLPADLQGATVLSVDLSFRGGAASNVWAALAEQAPPG